MSRCPNFNVLNMNPLWFKAGSCSKHLGDDCIHVNLPRGNTIPIIQLDLSTGLRTIGKLQMLNHLWPSFKDSFCHSEFCSQSYFGELCWTLLGMQASELGTPASWSWSLFAGLLPRPDHCVDSSLYPTPWSHSTLFCSMGNTNYHLSPSAFIFFWDSTVVPHSHLMQFSLPNPTFLQAEFMFLK